VAQPGLLFPQLFSAGRALNTGLLWLAFVSCLTSIVFVIAWSATLLTGLGIQPAQAALIAAMWQTGGAFGSIAVTRLIDSCGIGVVAVWILLAVPAVIAIGQVGASTTLLVSTVLIGGFFGSGGQVGMNAIAGLLYPAPVRATGVGSAFGIGRVGAILGPVLGGFLIAAGLPVGRLFGLMSFPFILAAGCAAALHFRNNRTLAALPRSSG
jgi:AAHS family 4-hydroxybenzoate transporter-like MFS transporter